MELGSHLLPGSSCLVKCPCSVTSVLFKDAERKSSISTQECNHEISEYQGIMIHGFLPLNFVYQRASFTFEHPIWKMISQEAKVEMFLVEREVTFVGIDPRDVDG